MARANDLAANGSLHGGATGRPPSRVARFALGLAVGAGGLVGAVVVWFMGFDPLWSVATVVAVGAVGASLANLGFEEDAEQDPAWAPLRHETPPGIRRDVAAIAGSLGARDRLSRWTAVRRMRARHRLARSTAVVRMRALLIAELHDRGLDPANRSDDEAVVALLGPDAIPILQPDYNKPVSPAAIERCLNAVERLATKTQGAA